MTILTPDYLKAVRLEALRKRTWYRVLDRVERGIFNLTIRLFDSVKSRVLASELAKILAKLRDGVKSAFTRHVEEYGVRQMWRNIEYVKDLGSDLAASWISMEYAIWLASNNYNNPIGWKKT